MSNRRPTALLGTALEAMPGKPQGLKSSSLKKPFALRMKGLRIIVE